MDSRFTSKFRVNSETGCWDWTTSTNGKGYGQFRVNGVLVYAHRFSYELHVGPIPEGMPIDHLCRNRGCVNPDHLEAVTSGENTRRGDLPEVTRERSKGNAYGANKGTCRAGLHPWPESRTVHGGRNVCRDCKNAARGRYRARMSERVG